MTQYSLFFPRTISRRIALPGSKSISNRALIINALSGSEPLRHIAECDDTEAVEKALHGDDEIVDIGAAGTAMRFLTAYFCCQPDCKKTLTGSERMKKRPIGPLVDTLRSLGADIRYLGEEGFPPLEINGRKLHGGEIKMKGDISSQYISALLLIAPEMGQELRIELTGDIVSRPYIDMTLSIMREYGAEADWVSKNSILCQPRRYQPNNYYVEGDWSAASYWFEMLALSPNLKSNIWLRGLRPDSIQGDQMVKDFFFAIGVDTEFGHGSQLKLTKRDCEIPCLLHLDFSKCPDLAQTLVCTCLGLEINFHFTGLSTLKIKETDRIAALIAEAGKLGYELREPTEGELAWRGERCEATLAPIDTYKDHRMAMAFAPLAMKFPGLTINNPEVISKSYPNFWNDLKEIGVKICTS